MISLRARVESYEILLGQLANQVDSAGQLAIHKALQEASEVDYCGRGYFTSYPSNLWAKFPD